MGDPTAPTPFEGGSVLCPGCAAENSQRRSACFLCGRSLEGAAAFVPPEAPKAGVEPRGATFHIASLMLLIAAVAVVLALLVNAPGLVVPLAIPATFASLRTLVVTRGREGRPPSVFDYLAVFVASFTFVCLVLASAVAAFFVTCLAIVSTAPGQWGGPMLGAGLVAGAIAGIAVPVALIVATVRVRNARGRDAAAKRGRS